MTLTRRTLRLACFLLIVMPVSPAEGKDPTGPLEAPVGPVILTIDGALAKTNGPGTASFDRAMIDRFRQHSLRTQTPWTDGRQSFEGPRLADILDRVGADGDTLLAIAQNDYAVEIPMSDAAEFGIILASRINGSALTLRTKGPLWVIYPFDADPVLEHERYYARSIWQLKKLTVR